MGFKVVYLSFSLKRDEFVDLLLLGMIDVIATPDIIGSDDKEKITLCGATDHRKYGLPGKEDGSTHFFNTRALYRGHYVDGRAFVKTQDQGKIYEGSLNLQIYPEDEPKE